MTYADNITPLMLDDEDTDGDPMVEDVDEDTEKLEDDDGGDEDL